MIKNFNWKLALLLILLGTIGIFSVIPYSLATLGPDSLPPEVTLSPAVIMVINAMSQIFMLAVLVFIGVLLLPKTGLKVPLLDALVHGREIPSISKKWMMLGVVVSFVGSLFVIFMDRFVFIPQLALPEQVENIAWWKSLLAMFYGGITEELMVRLFGMTLIVWLLALMMRKQADQIPAAVYYIAMFLAAILFGLGHLPATSQLFGALTPLLITRALLLNGILGIWFGYLYFRKGLEYAIVAHMSADLFLHVLL